MHNQTNKGLIFHCLWGMLFLQYFLQNVCAIEREKIIHYSDIDGLPINIVTCIEQDNYGYTWVGTTNGIARFDGNTFTTYKSLKGVLINNILVDRQNRVWVTAEKTLYSLNRLIDEFELRLDSYCRNIVAHNDLLYIVQRQKIKIINTEEFTEISDLGGIRDVHVEENGIWVSGVSNGVCFYDRESNFKNCTRQLLDGWQVNLMRKIDGKLFFTCQNGQLFVLTDNKNLKEVELEGNPFVKEIIKVDDQIWIATNGDGILILDRQLNHTKSIRKNSNDASLINSNSIYDIYLGRNNEVWVATYSAGLFCMQPDNSPFRNIVPEFRNPNSLVDKEGTAICLIGSKMFLGTFYGMSVLDEITGKYTNYSMNFLEEKLNGKKALAISKDSEDNIWVGTYEGLLGKFTPDMKLIETYHPCSTDPEEMQRIFLLHTYRKNNLLIGSYYQRKNLLNFDLRTGKAEAITLPPLFRDLHASFIVTSIRKNRNYELLVLAKGNGMFSINMDENILVNKFPEINNQLTFDLNDFYHDKKDYYWFATQNEGLVRMSKDGLSIDKWGSEQGLPTQTLLRIESVDDRYLWISTISGLCRFDMQTEQILIFDHRHGLPAKEFTQRTSTVTDDGRIIFGSIAGFTIVDPNKVLTDVSDSEVLISDITFHSKSIRHLEDIPPLSKPLEETQQITLPFNRNSFTLHFFSKQEELPQYNNYAYRLTGLENEWNYLGETRHTTYTNLSPGTYTFEVKSTNKSNIWSTKPTQLTIVIAPPWYLTWYVFIAYFICSIVLIVGLLYFYTQRIRLKKEVEMSEYKVQQEHELSERKLVFFTNISHDLKTPLTLIGAPVNELLEVEDLPESYKNKLLIIKYNSQRLYKLISDILDFRKLTQKQLPLKVSETKIGTVIENIHLAFNAECAKKHIDFKINISNQEFIYIELKKVEKILWNLMSNALKFTESEGDIYLSAEKEIIDSKPFLKLIVKDSGIGIPQEEKTNIFKRFYQKREGAKLIAEGTGIGLSIVKELVELHHGTIDLDSTPGLGSTFTVRIPTDKTAYVEDEIAIRETKTNDDGPEPKDASIEKITITENKSTYYNLPIILLVEDNDELREYMTGYFEKRYKVYEATDGIEGLEMVKSKKPDLIITDVMMPNMNGYDFCKTIRSNFETSHLPIIMLTANDLMEQQIEGLSAGADAYIAKPFDVKYLSTVIQSVLENRTKIRNRILGTSDDANDENKLTPQDVDFINELKRCIQDNLSNEKLGVEMLTSHFKISRTQLNRKIKSLTGQTPNNLIKSVRLKVAYELISERGLRVTEAAYQTGFSAPNYFTLCFKKEFGINPSQI